MFILNLALGIHIQDNLLYLPYFGQKQIAETLAFRLHNYMNILGDTATSIQVLSHQQTQ